MPTRPAIATALAKLVAAGYPHAPPAEARGLTAEVWAEDLAALSDAELAAAVGAYRRSADPADRWWPTPGRILACSTFGRTAGAIGTASDGERAFEDFATRMRWLIAMRLKPSRHDTEAHLDPADPYRNDAMFAGWAARPSIPDAIHDPIGHGIARRAWIAAYLEARQGHKADPVAVRSTLAIAQQARIAGPTLEAK
jgi:hypothetical protein